MYIDQDGTNPLKFWAQIASGLMVIGGAFCMFILGATIAIVHLVFLLEYYMMSKIS